ncbi:tail fiber domain-containing protein [Nocardioides sp. R-C-SC26]|uniref:tail fiber domain-containing protein n=1 Tax=Nocardioides sp. R-C-SC26 TaxID=2870414 RepID=UPI001E4AE5D6|nr:tail fiber domain-containing protein [Nocardioides sp. R-C-SC26]
MRADRLAGIGALTWRVVDRSNDLDVTGALADTGAPELTWAAPGGPETASISLNMPLHELPSLGEQSRLIVTDSSGVAHWAGFCQSPGAVSDDTREGFDLIAVGASAAGRDRIEPLIYADTETGSWSRIEGLDDRLRADQVNDDGVVGWRLGFPEDYAIGPGATTGIEYRRLAASDSGIGLVEVTLTGAATDTDFVTRVECYDDGALVSTATYPFTSASTNVTLTPAVGVNLVRITFVHTGAPTNNPTPFSVVTLTGLRVAGRRFDTSGAPSAAAGSVTSAAVVADLIGRGMLGPIDPAAVWIESSAVTHDDLAWPEGIRGTQVLEALRAADDEMTWHYTPGTANGFGFEWVKWAAEDAAVSARGARYVLGDDVALSRGADNAVRPTRATVYYTPPGTKEQRRAIASWPTEPGDRIIDADPVNLGEATAMEAETAAVDSLNRGRLAARAMTAVVGRRILDQVSGLDVEPWELRPGVLAMVQATGEVLRVTHVKYADGDIGTATLTLGSPALTVEERTLALLRGELDPTAPLIVVPPSTTSPGTTESPELEIEDGSIGEEKLSSALQDLLNETAAAIDTIDELNASYRQPTAPSGDLREGDVWFDSDDGNHIYVWNGSGWVDSTSAWLRTNPSASFPNTVASTAGIVGYNAGGGVAWSFLNSTGQMVTTGGIFSAGDISGSTLTANLVQSTALANRGVKINTAGLVAYDSVGSPTVTIDANTGTATFRGTVLSSIIEGSTVRTSAGSTRIELLADNTLRFVTPSGTITMTGASGNLSIDRVVQIQQGLNIVNGPIQFVGSGAGINCSIGPVTAQTLGVGSAATFYGSVTMTGIGGNSGGYVGIDGSGNLYQRSPSTRASKEEIEPLDDVDLAALYEVQPYRFRYRDRTHVGDRIFPGFMADDLHAAGLRRFVLYDTDDQPSGIDYAEWSVALQLMVRDLHARVSHLEGAAA